ncbi:MAG: hypothetical protein J5850_03095 [Clostridia bacterium]|nr:hypothetical protein [Clostridia bacterium]
MINILLYITGICILLCGACIAVIMYLGSQEYVNGLSAKYLKNYEDTDMIPNNIVLSIFGAMIRRVLLVVFSVIFIETAGACLLVVASIV